MEMYDNIAILYIHVYPVSLIQNDSNVYTKMTRFKNSFVKSTVKSIKKMVVNKCDYSKCISLDCSVLEQPLPKCVVDIMFANNICVHQ